MNNLIDEKQARAITGGRMPLVPVEYEAAVKALIACTHLDEAKYCSDKADALAAWAKIYKSDEAGLESKRLKLHAFRRMSQIANELRPNDKFAPRQQPNGGFLAKKLPGPVSLLLEKGLSSTQANMVRAVGSMPEKQFKAAIESKNPPAAWKIRQMKGKTSLAWKTFYGEASSPSSFRTYCRKYPRKGTGPRIDC